MEIEVGEYIRDMEGNIDRITKIHPLFKDIYLYSGTNGYQYSDNAIANHSKDIIDLVEVGDYVNGYRVDDIKDGVLISNPKGIDKSGAFIPIAQYKEDIKSILTHEQYEKMAYGLEE